MIRASILAPCLAAIALIGGLAGTASAQGTPTAVELPPNLVPPTDAVFLFELDARGMQIYTCEADPDDATSFVWTFEAPEANLLNDNGQLMGSHFADPTWQGTDGSVVVGEVLERADSPDPGLIPLLLLKAKENSGNGAFSTNSYIQRLDTVGGIATAEGCGEAHAAEETRVPYEATYAFFYPAAVATPVVALPTT